MSGQRKRSRGRAEMSPTDGAEAPPAPPRLLNLLGTTAPVEHEGPRKEREAMTKLTREKRERLRADAKAAMKAAGGGRWTRWSGHAEIGVLNKPRKGMRNDPGCFNGSTFIQCEDPVELDEDTANARRIARFVAAADPNTVLALLDALDAAEANAP